MTNNELHAELLRIDQRVEDCAHMVAMMQDGYYKNWSDLRLIETRCAEFIIAELDRREKEAKEKRKPSLYARYFGVNK